MLYQFGEFRLDDERFVLTGPDGQVHVEPQVFDVLRHLLVHRDRVVPKEELLDEVWGTRFVSESALTSRLKSARRAIGDDGQAQRVIKTVHGRGYHFVAPVEVVADAAAPTSRHRVPTRGTALIGRDTDVAGLADRTRHTRLVTITGPGGAGKTSVALEVAGRLDDELADGAVFVDLVPVRSADDLTRAVAEAADVLGDASRSFDRLVEHLAGRDVLVVLDNCEHVVDECARFAGALLTAGDAVRVLATSREPLGLVGEHVWPLASLGAAAPLLFVARAREVEPRIDWDPDDPAVVALCEQLDALPLALELAAGQLTRFDLTELARRLDGRLTLLSRRASTSTPRHSTMEATIGWSYRLLGTDEQRLLRHLSVFPATFDLDAVEQSAPPELDGDPAVVLGELVAKSLVARTPGTRRYRLLETIRTFAGELLVEAGEDAAARERHREQVVARAWREPRLARWMSASLAAAHRSDLDNARQAFHASVEGGCANEALEIALGASFLWRNAMGATEGAALVDALLAADLSPRDRLWLHVLQADVGQGIGDHRLMFDAAAAAHELAPDVDDPVVRCLAAHYAALAFLTEPEGARQRFADVVMLAVTAGDRRLVTLMEAFSAVVEIGAGELDDARRRVERLDRVASADGYDRFILDWTGWMLALAELDGPAAESWMAKQQALLDLSGIGETWLTAFSQAMTEMVDRGEVTPTLARAHALAEREGYQADGDCLLAVAYAAICAGRHDEAASLVGSAIRSRFNSTANHVMYRVVIDRILRQHLGPAELQTAMGAGRARSSDDVLREHGVTS